MVPRARLPSYSSFGARFMGSILYNGCATAFLHTRFHLYPYLSFGARSTGSVLCNGCARAFYTHAFTCIHVMMLDNCTVGASVHRTRACTYIYASRLNNSYRGWARAPHACVNSYSMSMLKILHGGCGSAFRSRHTHLWGLCQTGYCIYTVQA